MSNNNPITRAEFCRLFGKMFEGLSVPGSMPGLLGTARDPWADLKGRLNLFGWPNAEECEEAADAVFERASQKGGTIKEQPVGAPDKIYVSGQQRDLGEQIGLFTGKPGEHRRVGAIYSADDYQGLDDGQAEDMDEVAFLTAEKLVRAYNSYEILLEAVTRALPILRSHMGLTGNQTLTDRLAHDLCEEAITKAKEGFTDERVTKEQPLSS